jgi:hypothetical protein
MLDDTLGRINARWSAEGVPSRPGNPPEALAAFEAKYGVALPPAVRDYFAAVDGTGDHSDDAYLRFWPLTEVEPILDYNRWEPAEAQEYVGWFYFADFMLQSHSFAIRLMPDPADGGAVAHTPDPADGGAVAFERGGLFPFARSFDAFLELYLSDRDFLIYHLPS